MPTLESAAEYKESAIKLALGQLWWALPWLMVALAVAFVRGPKASYLDPLRHPFANPVFHPVFPAIWTVVILIRWRRLTRIDSLDLWRQDCGDPSATESDGPLDDAQAFAAGLQIASSDPQRALPLFRRAVDSDPSREIHWLSLALALASVDLPGEALTVMDTPRETDRIPPPPAFRLVRVQCLAALHLIPDAQHAARQALPFVEDESQLATIQQLLEAQPPPVRREQIAAHWFSLGRQAQLADRRNEAIELFRRAVYADPQNATCIGALAMSLAIAGAEAKSDRLQRESLEAFARALSIAPDPQVRFNHVQALHMFGRLEDALEAGMDLLSITPTDPLLLQVLEGLSLRLGRHA
jgi:tetratricopeptide (TPR) repeat protein